MYDLVVIGGGSGGLNVASAAAAVGASVALIENGKLGGECTHTACVPSKALIEAADLAARSRTAGSFGVRVHPPEIDFAAVMGRVRAVVADFAGSDSGQGLEAKGIEVVLGNPAFEAYDTVIVDGARRISARRFVIATGSRPAVPPIGGLAKVGYRDNNTIWDLDDLPPTLAVIGGGPVGLELAQAFARLGSAVTILNDVAEILPREDPEIAAIVREALTAEGITFRLGVEIVGVTARDGRKVVAYRAADGSAVEAIADEILVAAGRLANVEGLNLEAAGLRATSEKGIEVDESMRTRTPHIFAIGDVIGHHQWTHAAEREAAVAFQNAVLRLPKKIDYRVMPWATFTDPEVATVGTLDGDGDQVRILRADYSDLDRARIDGRPRGLAKVAATPSGKILGATIVGDHAALVLQEFVVAMAHGLTLGDLAETVHPYPTHAGLARKIANQFSATRLDGGFVRSALRLFYGFTPRQAGADHTPVAAEPEPAASHVAHSNGHGH